MNLPNKLTALRVIMIPAFMALFYAKSIPGNYFWALVVFSLASLTDMLDGKIARERGLVTDFGILMDPLADKLLVMSAIVCFVEIGAVAGWIAVTILAREFLVTSIRLVAAGKGMVIAADKWGKIKTVAQMAWIMAGLLSLWLAEFSGSLTGIFHAIGWIVLAATVFSGINYVTRNIDIFKDI